MVAHEKALEWQELFDLAIRESLANDDIVSMGYRVAGRSKAKSKLSLTNCVH